MLSTWWSTAETGTSSSPSSSSSSPASCLSTSSAPGRVRRWWAPAFSHTTSSFSGSDSPSSPPAASHPQVPPRQQGQVSGGPQRAGPVFLLRWFFCSPLIRRLPRSLPLRRRHRLAAAPEGQPASLPRRQRRLRGRRLRLSRALRAARVAPHGRGGGGC